MRDLSELRIRPFGKKRPFPPVTEKDIHDFESAFDVQLPLDYIEFLCFFNGGTLQLAEYNDPVMRKGLINDFYGLGSRDDDRKQALLGEKWDHGNLWGETRVFRELFHDSGVPFAEDGGSNILFLDFSENSPCVSLYLIESKKAHRLASSFSEFLDMLRLRTPPRGSSSDKPREIKRGTL